MIGGLASGDVTIVASHTGPGDCAVIHADRGPSRGAMAIFTGVGSQRVSAWLARRRTAVMTVETGCCYGRVIHNRRRPAVDGVTIVACAAALDMPAWLARCRAAVLTG